MTSIRRPFRNTASGGDNPGGPRGVDFTEGCSGEAFEGGEGEGVVFEAGVEGTEFIRGFHRRSFG